MLLVAGCTALGLVVGSFLNVVIWRFPRGESVVRPASRCPGCQTPIAPRDNVPVLSWLLLRGRCRTCRTAVSVRYPAVELLTALLSGGIAWRLATTEHLAAVPAYLWLGFVGVALAAIDIDCGRLPTPIVRWGLGVGAVLLTSASYVESDWSALRRAAIALVALWSFYFVLHVIKPAGMGMGDVRLSALLGLYLGWLGYGELVVGAFLAFLLGSVLGLLQAALAPDWERRSRGVREPEPPVVPSAAEGPAAGDPHPTAVTARPVTAPSVAAGPVTAPGVLKRRIPYGPYMLAGALVAVFVGEAIAAWYLDLMGL